jgi:hypothetical protein
MVQANQSRARRFAFVADVEVTQMDGSQRVRQTTLDLSLSGCHISTSEPWPVGTKLRIRIVHKSATFGAVGRVIHVRPNSGMGILFTHVEPGEQVLLDRWLADVRNA